MRRCGDLDILAAGAPRSLMDAFTSSRLVERVLGHGDTKSSVLLAGGFQADLRLVPQESLGAAQQYFTGSKAHNIALRDRAIQRGLKLNEYGLFRVDDAAKVAGETEAGIYEALGLAFVPPELRENRGEIAAAEARTLPRLIQWQDLRGDLHMHTTATDGRADAETMALAARAAGLEYIAITDHSQALAMANGLDEIRALQHARAIRELDARLDGITVLAGIECDIRPDGAMDLADDCLAQLDIVIASVHSAFNQDEAQMTDRLLRAIACPWVDVIGHPTGRLILKREGYRFDLERVLDAAAAAGVAIEINSQVHRLDLDETRAQARARSRREARDRLRRPFAGRARRHALGDRDRPAGLARAGRHPQHTPGGRAPREPPAQPPMSEQDPRSAPPDRLAEIKRLYFSATRASIDRDFDRAIDVLKEMPEEERHRATVYMQGLAEMRKEFKRGRKSDLSPSLPSSRLSKTSSP